MVTAAGSGIGRETALLCARLGAALALCDLDEEGLQSTARAANALGAEVLIERLDVADPERMGVFAARVHERFDTVELLVNNTDMGVIATFLDTELSDWRHLIDVNLMGVVHGCHCFVPRMVANGRGGHVVNVASQAGFQANHALSAYSATKFAVLGFSEALRAELRPHGICVTAVCPGVVNTGGVTCRSAVRGERARERRAKLERLCERRGYGPDRVAMAILRAVGHDRAVAPVALEARLGYLLSRIAPPLSRWTAARLARLAG